MSEDSRNYTEAAGDHLALSPDTTFSDVLRAGVGPLAHLSQRYPERLAALRSAHERWVREGRPSTYKPTAPPAAQTAPAPAPAPEPRPVPAPDPSSVTSMRDLTAMGVGAFNAFKEAHPGRYAELASASGTRP